nr:MAG TPA: hypothetical protein [Caudoviricetes sp.]
MKKNDLSYQNNNILVKRFTKSKPNRRIEKIH